MGTLWLCAILSPPQQSWKDLFVKQAEVREAAFSLTECSAGQKTLTLWISASAMEAPSAPGVKQPSWN